MCPMQVAAGLTTGALGIMVASPTDLVKVRMQAEQAGGPKRYPNARAAYGIIMRCACPAPRMHLPGCRSRFGLHFATKHAAVGVKLTVCSPGCREEGVLGLWKGVTPNIGRNAIINAAELASYDSVRASPSR